MFTTLSNLIDRSAIVEQLNHFFAPQRLEQLARRSRLIERSTSRLNGQAFLMLNVFASDNNQETSLEDQCSYLYQTFGIRMKKQSLDQRFNTHAVRFMRRCFTEALALGLSETNLKQLNMGFKRVLLTDATSFQLPATLAPYYQSNGGHTSGASVKIHHSYDLLSGRSVDIQLFSGCENDNTYRLHAAPVMSPQAGDLYLTDLGYFDLVAFQHIDQAGAYYLSRFRTRTSLYSQTAQRLDLPKFLAQQSEPAAAYAVYAGKRHRLKTYLIAERVPEQIAKQRLINLTRNARRNSKWRVTRERKQLCNYNLYLTNVPQAVVSPQDCRALYQLRWQIEILFKTWKSLYGIHQVRKMSIFRFECFLFGTLIALLLSQHIQQIFRSYHWKTERRELSAWKGSKIMKRNWLWFRDCLLAGDRSVKRWIRTMFAILYDLGNKESKKLRENHYRTLPLHKLHPLA